MVPIEGQSIDNNAVLYSEDVVGSRRFIDQLRAIHPGSLHDVGGGSHFCEGNAWGVTAGGVGQFNAQSRLHPSFHCSKDIDSANEIDHQPIPNHLSELVFPRKGNTVFIQNGQDGIGCPEVHTYPKRTCDLDRFTGRMPVGTGPNHRFCA